LFLQLLVLLYPPTRHPTPKWPSTQKLNLQSQMLTSLKHHLACY
jgi:hypothetical protein